MKQLKWFYSFLKKYRPQVLLGLLLTTIVSVLSMVNPKIYGMIVDDVIYGGKAEELLPLAGCIFLTTAIISVCRYVYQLCFEKASQGVL